MPASQQYYTELNEWLQEDGGIWAQNVWRWLSEREVDMNAMLAPAPMTAAKSEMLAVSKSKAHIAVEAILEHWPVAIIGTFQIKDILQPMLFRLDIQDNADKVILAVVRGMSDAVDKKIKVDGRVFVPRIIKTKMTPEAINTYVHNEPTPEVLADARALMAAVDLDQMRSHIEDALHLHDH